MVTFHSTRLELTTTASFSCHDISADLQAFVDGTGIRNGLLVQLRRLKEGKNIDVSFLLFRTCSILWEKWR